MTVSEARSANAAERLLLWAVVLSLSVHLAVFGGWKWGQSHGWWKRLALPSWMELGRKNLASTIPKKLPPMQKPQQAPLLFIDVVPALATETPPEKPKFYSPANSVAANPTKTIPSDMPQINGSQDKVIKTIPQGAKSFPLQPSPPKPPDKTEAAEVKPLPKPTYTPGDLTSAKPAEKMRESKGTSDADQGTATEAVQPHQRPRTIQEALVRQGSPTPPTRLTGGAPRLAISPSMDSIRTSFGDYDIEMFRVIEDRWDHLFAGRTLGLPGKVVVDFNLHSDGRISDVKITANEVTDLLGFICERAIVEREPYKEWPQKMRVEVPDPRHIQITFNYDIE